MIDVAGNQRLNGPQVVRFFCSVLELITVYFQREDYAQNNKS